MASKLNLWFKHYTDQSNNLTFLNNKESARAAKYCTKNPALAEKSLAEIGCQNSIKLKKKIAVWLDEVGLSDNKVKTKLIGLLAAKETKFIKIKGAFKASDLPAGSKVIGTSGLTVTNQDGVEYTDGETLVALNVEALGIQAKMTDLAVKVRGLNAPEKIEHTFPELTDEQLDKRLALLMKKEKKS